MEPYAWEYHDPDHPRPAEVALVEVFLNTVDRHTFGGHAAKPAHRRDQLADPERLRDWLVAHELLEESAAVGARDLDDARALRDGLRAWLQARQGLDHDRAALRRSGQVLDRLCLRVGLEPDGAELRPAGGPVIGALGRLVADLATAQATGALQRLKICSAPDCQLVYFDHSRSRTSRWCSMETCGNRIKTRRYRQHRRQRAG